MHLLKTMSTIDLTKFVTNLPLCFAPIGGAPFFVHAQLRYHKVTSARFQWHVLSKDYPQAMLDLG